MPNQPQAFISSYAPRLRQYANCLLVPAPQTLPTGPSARTTKRGTAVKSYAEDDYDEDDIFEDNEPRRQTGLRTRREDPALLKESAADKIGKEIHAPVEVQGIWREWMGKLRIVRTDKQLHAQTNLPLTLIPIRLDVHIQGFIPQPALPLPPNHHELNINSHLPAYRQPDVTPDFRLRDIFLWNLHETLITPDQFATILIHDLDLPPNPRMTADITNQIRQQLEEYAGVALHPLFQSTDTGVSAPPANSALTAQRSSRPPVSRQQSSTPLLAPSTPSHQTNGNTNGFTNGTSAQSPTKATVPSITATASPLPPPEPPRPYWANNELDPDDTYRCIVSLSINLEDKLYTDKFEWSLLHPVGCAEKFARLTCADLGLHGEWVPAMAHAIYEAVLRLKKEACESGALFLGGTDLDNMNYNEERAGWRLDQEGLGEDWEPRLEILSKEEIEKREGDRERQLRRLRRETARFSSTSNMQPVMPTPQEPPEEERMGRGERAKRKKRHRSLSPVGRQTPEVGNAGYGGGGAGTLTDNERYAWRCSHCAVTGNAVWGVRDGPAGPRTLCSNCGLVYERDKRLPAAARGLHAGHVVGGR